MEKVSIYTDGSHLKSKDFIGCGAICEFHGKEYAMSSIHSQQMFSDLYKTEDKVSNPTAEIVAAATILASFLNITVPVHIEIIADYIGVKEWNEFKWKANKVYIQSIIQGISQCTQEIVKNGGIVSYRHIPGHQKGNSVDAVMNNKSDKHAKSLEIYNEFNELVQIINKNQN